MQVTETKAEGLRREYAAKALSAEITAKVDAKIEEVKPNARVNGFRKGKAPLAILKKMYGKSVLGEVMRDLVDETLRSHLEETGHRPTAEPEIRIVNEDFDEGHDLDIEFGYDLMPDVPAVDFKALKLERLTVAVDDGAVEEALGSLAQNAQNFEAKDGAAEEGDQVAIDFIGRVDGEAFEGGAAEDFPLTLGSGQFIPGFEGQLVGAAAGDKRDVEVTFPANYGAENLAGKPAVFEVAVKEVRGPAEVKIDDDFAKRYGAEDLEDLKSQIRDRLAEEYKGAARAQLKRKLLDKLDEVVSFDLPNGMVEQEARQIAQQLQREDEQTATEAPEADASLEADPSLEVDPSLEADQASAETADAAPAAPGTPTEPTEEHRKLASRRVKLGLLLADIGAKNEIQVTEAEVNNAIMAQAQQYRGQEREFFEFARNNAQIRQQISAPIFEDKVVDYAIELADVEDRSVSAEQLQKELEAMEEESSE